MAAKCTDCQRPLGDDAYYCAPCLEHLEQVIAEMPALLTELEVAATRQARIGDRSGVRSRRKVDRYWEGSRKDVLRRTPFDWTASDLQWVARNTLTTWTRIAEEGSGDRATGPIYAGPICPKCKHASCWTIRTRNLLDETAMSLYLIRQLPWFRMRQEVTELMDELLWLRSSIIRTVDLAAELWFAGPCDECGADLYCRPDAPAVECRTTGCELSYDVKERREWLLAVAEDQLATATVISRALTGLGEPVTPSVIRNLKARNLIYAHSIDRDGDPLYRVGDVREILRRRKAKKEERMSA